MSNIFQIITVASAILMTILILLQTRGASLGAGFGGSGELFTARRGVDKSMYQVTIVLAVLFVASLVLGIIRG
ncbi:MAG TPA: preprotein translocase subunit SecG [Candidatus Saccharibacteria bacterium]|jgi:preprotein translocase subunit SecG|nr:preprotein translocase subunit SecG [Patescibacteria group bacterium]HMS31247.1 preprotein translocase subunit SecG [Candidatus Saccharibacteria bacterium]